MSDTTRYSKPVPGDKGNYHWTAKFDMTDGYVGITQVEVGQTLARVLLSPRQMHALIDFWRSRKEPT